MQLSVTGIAELAMYINLPIETLKASIAEYRKQASNGSDPYGKTMFPNAFSDNLDEEEFFAGKVMPVLHYCMGGLTTDQEGRVLDEKKDIMKGLYAAGEVVGGVHGDNRLAGNSLLECLVFGTIIGKKMPVASNLQSQNIDVAHLTQP
jgi:succinate dehydrogenase/fumarate reductase flavoprotein subunit